MSTTQTELLTEVFGNILLSSAARACSPNKLQQLTLLP